MDGSRFKVQGVYVHHTYVCICTYVRIWMYMHIYMYLHIHTRVLARSVKLSSLLDGWIRSTHHQQTIESSSIGDHWQKTRVCLQQKNLYRGPFFLSVALHEEEQ